MSSTKMNDEFDHLYTWNGLNNFDKNSEEIVHFRLTTNISHVWMRQILIGYSRQKNQDAELIPGPLKPAPHQHTAPIDTPHHVSWCPIQLGARDGCSGHLSTCTSLLPPPHCSSLAVCLPAAFSLHRCRLLSAHKVQRHEKMSCLFLADQLCRRQCMLYSA